MSQDDQEGEQECPMNIATGMHRYFIFKTFEVFEPVFTTDVITKKPVTDPNDMAYYKKEYAILGCNCGSVIKKEVTK